MLREATADADWTIRRSAVEALGGHVAVAPDEPAIVRALADSNDYVVRTASRAAAEGSAVWPLARCESVDSVLRHRVWACRLAARFGAREGDETIRWLLTDRDGHVRKAARISLGSPDSAT